MKNVYVLPILHFVYKKLTHVNIQNHVIKKVLNTIIKESKLFVLATSKEPNAVVRNKTSHKYKETEYNIQMLDIKWLCTYSTEIKNS